MRKVNKNLRKQYNIESDEDVLVVVNINPEGEAYEKGIREGDMIKNVGTKRVKTVKEFNRLIEKSRNKGAVLLLVKKPGGGSRFFTLNY